MLILLTSMLFLLLTYSKERSEILYWSTALGITYALGFMVGISQTIGIFVFIGILFSRLFNHNFQWTVSWNTDKTRALALSIPFLLTASMPTRFLDAGTYYEQTSRWFEVGIPQGIGNFSLFLMQASLAHSNEAIINSIIPHGQNDVTAILSTFLICISFVEIPRIKLPVLIAGVGIFALLVHFTQSSSSDLLLIAFLVFHLFKQHSGESNFMETFALIAIFPFIKPVGIGLSLLLAIPMFNRDGFKYLSILTIPAFFYIFKSYWTSGWIPGIGSVADFAIPKEAHDYLEFRSTFYEYVGRDGFLFNTDILFGILYAILAVIQLFKSREDAKRLLFTGLIHAVILGYWFTNAPSGRYLIPFYIYFLFNIKFFNLQIFNGKKHVLLLVCVGLISVLPNWGSLFQQERLKRFFDYGGISNVNWLKPANLWKPKTTSIEISGGLSVQMPTGQFQCFDADFPCNTNLVHYYGGDSLYYPVFYQEVFRFTYYSESIKSNSKQIIDSLSNIPPLPIGIFKP